jgi:hypothetical protein
MSYNPQNPNGQVNMASSAPVVLASDQSTNWNGELIEAIEALRTALVSLTRATAGMSLPDTLGRQRVTIEASTTVPVSGSVTATVASTTLASGTLTTLSNQTQIGGLAAVDQIPSLMNMVGQNLRRNIIVT